MHPAFGPIRQLCFVVPDVHAAIRHWVDGPGVGPFYCIEDSTVTDFTYRGRPAPCPRVSVALAQQGPVQIELLQQHDDVPSVFRTFIDTVGHGLQHVAYWTEHFDDLMATALARGYVEAQAGKSGRGRPDDRFAYLESGAHHGSTIEVSERGAEKRALFDAIARASVDWDGADPVRTVEALRAEIATHTDGAPR